MSPTIMSFVLLMLSSCLMMCMYLYTYLNQLSTMLEWELSHLGHHLLTIPLLVNPENMLLSSVVLFISSNVMGFASTYMQEDPHPLRFNSLVLMFVGSMNLLIFIPNMVVMLMGWDGLGVISFLLVIYYSNPSSLSAGMITALTNRLGDTMILLSIAWLVSNNNWSMCSMWPSNYSVAITTSITLAACTKSAQMPFSSWLPAAMAAPTPVSALVHSSTLVTAGVFILTRLYPFLSLHPFFNTMIMTVACLTMLMSAMGAMMEPDLKKIIALSTLSQLSVMMASIGLGLPKVALFHLMTHALFKALLFMCAGNIIHFNSHSQDLRTTGSLAFLPMTTASLYLASLALCGTPFLSAFYSKDMILEFSLMHPASFPTISLMFLSTAMTSAYSTRLMFMMMWSPISLMPLNSSNENRLVMAPPMVLMTVGAVMGGSMLNWMMMQPHFPSPIPEALKSLTLLSIIMGLCVGSWGAMRPESLSFKHPRMSWTMAQMWALSPISKQLSIKLPMSLGFRLTHTIDQGWQEMMGAQGSTYLAMAPMAFLRPMYANIISTQLMLSLMFTITLMLTM